MRNKSHKSQTIHRQTLVAFGIAKKKNPLKTITKRSLVAIVLAVVLIFGFILSQVFLANFKPRLVSHSSITPVTKDIAVAPNPAQFVPGLPAHLKIPAINVDAVVEPVGMDADGLMATTAGPNEVGWYNLGQRPGEQGSAVITGHYGWKNGIPAAFDKLSSLDAGDKVYIEDKSGVTMIFIVRVLRSYDQKADATNVFRSTDGKIHLNLITCEGAWDKVAKSYSNRIIVFTDLQ